MLTKKRIIFLFCILILLILIYIFTPNVLGYLVRQRAAKAAGTFPYQIGLTNVVMVKCFTTTPPPICNGGTLCVTKDFATCSNYYDVSGTPSGGMGSNALFSMTAVTQSGLTAGGQLIAGGMSPVLMDNGVLASSGGCFGCYAKLGSVNKIVRWFDYIIAGN